MFNTHLQHNKAVDNTPLEDADIQAIGIMTGASKLQDILPAAVDMCPSNALGVAAAFALTDKATLGLPTTGSPEASRVLPAEQITQWLFAIKKPLHHACQ